MGESSAEGAARETLEEAKANVEVHSTTKKLSYKAAQDTHCFEPQSYCLILEQPACPVMT